MAVAAQVGCGEPGDGSGRLVCGPEGLRRVPLNQDGPKKRLRRLVYFRSSAATMVDENHQFHLQNRHELIRSCCLNELIHLLSALHLN